MDTSNPNYQTGPHHQKAIRHLSMDSHGSPHHSPGLLTGGNTELPLDCCCWIWNTVIAPRQAFQALLAPFHYNFCRRLGWIKCRITSLSSAPKTRPTKQHVTSAEAPRKHLPQFPGKGPCALQPQFQMPLASLCTLPLRGSDAPNAKKIRRFRFHTVVPTCRVHRWTP